MTLNDESERMWEEAVVAYIKSLPTLLFGRTEKPLKYVSSSLSQPGFEPGSYQIQFKSVKVSSIFKCRMPA